ncbi:hypothetical protein GHV24_05555 [Proteus mirabilis]|nr:hypothetical protein [Proteus mirabilis]
MSIKLIQFIEDILNKDALFIINKKNSSSEVVITEDASNSAISEMKVDGVPDLSVAFTLDLSEFKQPSRYLDVHNDKVNKTCDFIIISLRKIDEENKTYHLDVIVGELKSSKIYKKSTVQIENSIFFVEYIINLIKFHYENDINIKVNYIRRAISSKVVKTAIGKNPIGTLGIKCPGNIRNKKCTIMYRALIN